jgi:hypothetical protein
MPPSGRCRLSLAVPWLRRALNEDFRTVWGYWQDVHESFLAEKQDIEHRVDYVLTTTIRTSFWGGPLKTVH